MSVTKRILFAVILCMGLVVYITDTSELETHTDIFCAYDRVFVRFKEGNKVWGTILLDDSGIPVKCHEGDFPSVKILNKGNII